MMPVQIYNKKVLQNPFMVVKVGDEFIYGLPDLYNLIYKSSN
jgi:hypothetical protein